MRTGVNRPWLLLRASHTICGAARCRRAAVGSLSADKGMLTAALTTAQLKLKDATPEGFAAEAAELRRATEAAKQEAATAREAAAAAEGKVAEAQRREAEVGEDRTEATGVGSCCFALADWCWPALPCPARTGCQAQLLMYQPIRPCRWPDTCARRLAAWQRRSRHGRRGWRERRLWRGRSVRCAASWQAACGRTTPRARCRCCCWGGGGGGGGHGACCGSGHRALAM